MKKLLLSIIAGACLGTLIGPAVLVVCVYFYYLAFDAGVLQDGQWALYIFRAVPMGWIYGLFVGATIGAILGIPRMK